MNTTLNRFVRILRIELEDLYENIEEAVQQYQEEEKTGQETEHVCEENMALLRNEEHGLRCYDRVLDSVDMDRYASVESLAADVKRSFRLVIRRTGLAEAVYVLVEQRIDRLVNYVTLPA
jgi:hypothetical protein